MNSRTLTLLVALFAISGLLLSAIPADTSDGADDGGTYVRGLICEIGSSGPVPAKDVPVTLIYEGTAYSGSTDTDGYFKIKISDSSLIFSSKKVQFAFTLDGYSIFSLPDTMTSLEPDYTTTSEVVPVAEIDLNGINPDEDGVYTITNGEQHCILLGDTYVTVSFTVTDNETGRAIRNAEITLRNNQGTYTGFTDSDGICRISTNVLIGTYSINIKCDGYEEYNDSVTITKTNTKLSLEMERKELATYFGLTLYHLLMIFGVSVGLCLVLISYVLCKRTWNNVDETDMNQ